MKASCETKKLIKEIEMDETEFKNCSYLNPVNLTVIGWGHRVKYPEEKDFLRSDGNCITRTRMEELFDQDIAAVETCLNKMLVLTTLNLTCYQFGALVSWTFNIGCANAAKSTLVKKLNENKTDNGTVKDELNRWVIGPAFSVQGLIKRRGRESDFYAGKTPYNITYGNCFPTPCPTTSQ
jgi:GH24 family phage-related lysozyme (muramidase)